MNDKQIKLMGIGVDVIIFFSKLPDPLLSQNACSSFAYLFLSYLHRIATLFKLENPFNAD